MVKENIKSIFSLMAANEDVAAKLAGISSPEEAIAILSENNINVSVDDLKEMVDALHGDEIPVEMLDMVAGGGKVVDFFWGFCDGLNDSFYRVKDVFTKIKWW